MKNVTSHNILPAQLIGITTITYSQTTQMYVNIT